jgi:hypothetical protein
LGASPFHTSSASRPLKLLITTDLASWHDTSDKRHCRCADEQEDDAGTNPLLIERRVALDREMQG